MIIISHTATLVSGLEAELRTLQRKLARRDNEILRQERELHKLRVSSQLVPAKINIFWLNGGRRMYTFNISFAFYNFPESLLSGIMRNYLTSFSLPQSVLQQATDLVVREDHLLDTIQDTEGAPSLPARIALTKKQGVSGQSIAAHNDIKIEVFEKDFRCKTLIKEAIMENDFLKNLTPAQASGGEH